MSIVHDFESAFNRQDVEALIAWFTPAGSYVDTFFGPHAGHAELRAPFQLGFKPESIAKVLARKLV